MNGISATPHTTGWTKPTRGLQCIHPVVYHCTDQNSFFRALMYYRKKPRTPYEISEERSVPGGTAPVRAIGFLVEDGLTNEAYQVDLYNVDVPTLDQDIQDVFGEWDKAESLEMFLLGDIWEASWASKANVDEVEAMEESLRTQRHERPQKTISEDKVQEYRDQAPDEMPSCHDFPVLTDSPRSLSRLRVPEVSQGPFLFSEEREYARCHLEAMAMVEEAEVPFQDIPWSPIVTTRPCVSLVDWLIQLALAQKAGHNLAVCDDLRTRPLGFIDDETDEWVCLDLAHLHIGDPIPETVAKSLGRTSQEIKQLLNTEEGRTLLITGALPEAPPASDERLDELSATWCAEAEADKPVDVGVHQLVRPSPQDPPVLSETSGRGKAKDDE